MWGCVRHWSVYVPALHSDHHVDRLEELQWMRPSPKILFQPLITTEKNISIKVNALLWLFKDFLCNNSPLLSFDLNLHQVKHYRLLNDAGYYGQVVRTLVGVTHSRLKRGSPFKKFILPSTNLLKIPWHSVLTGGLTDSEERAC